MSVLPPVDYDHRATLPRVVAELAWLEVLRASRGWRWRTYMLLCLAGAHWFSRMASFGPGASVWFPGGPSGVAPFSALFALAGLLVGAEALSAWEQANARRFLDGHLLRPGRWLAAKTLAGILLLVPGACIVTFWAAIGAWRAGLEVLWAPSAVYLALVALPIIIASVCTGMGLRVAIRNELAALALGVLLLFALLAFRLFSAPAVEIFSLASDSFGILIPWSTLLRDAVLTSLYGLPFIAVALLLLPLPRTATARPGALPSLRKASAFFSLQRRQWTAGGLFIAMLLAGIGAFAFARILEDRPAPPPEIDWSRVSRPDTAPDHLPAARILHRQIVLPDDADGMLEVTLTLQVQPWTALSFGHTLALVEGPAMQELEGGVYLLESLDAKTEKVSYRFVLRPRGSAERLWERAWHPRFHRFASLGPWYGESVAIDFRRRYSTTTASRSPFSVIAPRRAGMEWAAGGAHVRAREDKVHIDHSTPGLPSRLIAADLVEVASPTTNTLNLSFLVQPRHAPLASQLPVIYVDQLTRLNRIFGPRMKPIVLHEVPEQNPEEELAISAASLDRLQALLPAFSDFFAPTRQMFIEAFEPMHAAIVREAIVSNFSHIPDRLLLLDGLSSYIHRHALGRGRFDNLQRRLRRDVVFVPWPQVRGEGFPFDIQDAELPVWEVPLSEVRMPIMDFERLLRRAMGFHHMLRGVMGEDAWGAGLQTMMQKGGGQLLTVEVYRQVMESAYGGDLGWFFEQWLEGSAMPQYAIVEGQAFLVEDPRTRALTYRVKVRVRNDGTGRMPVPWILATEGDPIRSFQWLNTGEEAEILIESEDRPVAFELDPEGWIVQLILPGLRESNHPRILFKTISEL